MDAMSDPRPLYARALEQAAGLIAAVRADQLAEPTPCGDYDVRALLSHLVGGVHRAAHVGEGGNTLDVPARVDGVADDGWPAAFATARDRVLAAWADDAKLDRTVSVPWGTVPGRGCVAGYVLEVVTHGWDLATATGRQAELDTELGEFALSVAHRFVPADRRSGTGPSGGPVPFGPVVEVPAGADVYPRLAGWLGREQ